MKVDKTAPVASPSASPAANSFGWNNSDVTVAWNWSDGSGSGIDPANCTTTSTSSGTGAAVTVSATCKDVAGNTATASYVVKVDKTAPVASPSASPAANSFGWNNSDVTVAWNWSDGSGSGIDPANCTTTSTSSGTGAAVTVSATCKDVADNTATASYVVKVDKTAPQLAPTVSANPVLLGSAASATPNATDPLSGVASSSCGALDTSTIGAKTVECIAADKAGNTSSVSVPYVVGFGVGQLAPPPRTKFKAGSTVPLKFQLTGPDGQPIATTMAQSLPPCAAKVVLGTQAPVCAVYDPLTSRFQANLKIPAGQQVGTEVTIRVTVTIGAATVATANTSIIVTK